MEIDHRRRSMILALMMCAAILPGGVTKAAAEEPAAKKPTDEKKEEPKKPEEKKPDDKNDKKPEDIPAGRPVSIGQYYDTPQIKINLLAGGRKSVYIVIDIVLEMGNEKDRQKLDIIMPVIIDTFSTYLSQLTPADFNGSMGVYRLRDELLMRAVTVCDPIVINNILIKEMLIK